MRYLLLSLVVACGGSTGSDAGTDGSSDATEDVTSGNDASNDAASSDASDAATGSDAAGGDAGIGASCNPNDSDCKPPLLCCAGGVLLQDASASYKCTIALNNGCPLTP